MDLAIKGCGIVSAYADDNLCLSSTTGGDSSSEFSYDGPVSFDRGRRLSVPLCYEQSKTRGSRETSPMPSTRESSPEPLWHGIQPREWIENLVARQRPVRVLDQGISLESLAVRGHQYDAHAMITPAGSNVQTHGVQSQPSMLFSGPLQAHGMNTHGMNTHGMNTQGMNTHGMNAMNREVMPNPAQLAPMSPAEGMQSGAQMLLVSHVHLHMQQPPAPPQYITPTPCVAPPPPPPPPPPTDRKVPSASKAARQSRVKQAKQEALTKSKSTGETESPETPNLRAVFSKSPQGDDFLTNINGGKKDALCKYIYSLMQKKGLTSPGGYLLVDILSTLWRSLVSENDRSMNWQVAKPRFASLLRSAPEYFEILERGLPQGTFRVAMRAEVGRSPATAQQLLHPSTGGSTTPPQEVEGEQPAQPTR